MYEQAPFPETSLSAGTTTSEEPMLRKANWQRFGETGHYRDVPAAVAFAADGVGGGVRAQIASQGRRDSLRCGASCRIAGPRVTE